MTDFNCQAGLYCDNPELNLLGSICKLRKPVGARCEYQNECLTLMCENGLCVPANKQAVFCL